MKRLLFACVLFAGCGDTGQPSIRHAAVGIGTAAREVEVGDYKVTLSVARVGFGPAVFCASRAASEDLCPAALAELTQVAPLDGLSTAPQPLGTVNGFVGTARSAAFGYAITWLPTETRPQPKSAAPGGHSAHLEGTATHKTSGASFTFAIDADVLPLNRGDDAVSLAGLNAPLDERTARLEVRVDPNAWVAQIDFAELAAGGSTSVNLASDSRAASALVIGMTSLAPPIFTFNR